MDLVPFTVTKNSVIMINDDVDHVLVLLKVQGINVPITVSAYDGGCIAAAAFNYEDFDENSPGNLAHGILAALGGTLLNIAITEFVDNEFHAVMLIRKPGETEEIAIKVLPTYAIVLALKSKVPMLIDHSIVIEASAGEAVEELVEVLEQHAPGVLET